MAHQGTCTLTLPVTSGPILAEIKGNVVVLTLNRKEVYNAACLEMIHLIPRILESLPSNVKVVVLCGTGQHFCSGADLREHLKRDPSKIIEDGLAMKKAWDALEFTLPVITVMKGYVVGAGLEMAVSTHIRIAEESAMYMLPEVKRGIYPGGGATVRVSRTIGMHRVREMMLTGRRFSSTEGQAIGLSHYLVKNGEGLELAFKLAELVSGLPPTSCKMTIDTLPVIDDMGLKGGFIAEGMAAALTQNAMLAAHAQEKAKL